MSVKDVKAFFAKMEGDKVLLEKVGSLHKKSKENMDEAIANLVKIASAAGFEFTTDDYLKVRTHKQKDTKLSAESFGKGLGGCNSNWTCARVKTI